MALKNICCKFSTIGLYKKPSIYLVQSYPWQIDTANGKFSCLAGFSPRYFKSTFAPIENPNPMNFLFGNLHIRSFMTISKSSVQPIKENIVVEMKTL